MPYQPNSLIPEALPVELNPAYRTSTVNEPVILYDGQLEFVEDNHVISGTGRIRLEWVPVPQVTFGMDAPDGAPPPGSLRFPVGLLRMTDGRSAAARVLGMKLSGGDNATAPRFSGIVDTAEFGSADSIEYALFHLPNFRSFSGSNTRDESGTRCQAARAVVEGGGWRITLDELPNESATKGRKFGEQIEAMSGFGITHVGRLERISGDSFSATDAKPILEALSQFLSFCRGSWVAPVLPVGFDLDGKRTWEEWRGGKIERWHRVGSWFDSLSCVGLVEVFSGFLLRWNDEAWKEPIRLALHWYVESNMCAGGVEGGTILSQAAFELLAWTLLVEDRRVLSEFGFQKLPASDKLRLLLSACGIPLTIPSSLGELTKSAKAFDWDDGAKAITEVRNALVHASPKKRKKVLGGNTGTRVEAWSLGLWYLELVLLRLFDFQGKYSDRLVQDGWIGQNVKTVPWVTTPSTDAEPVR